MSGNTLLQFFSSAVGLIPCLSVAMVSQGSPISLYPCCAILSTKPQEKCGSHLSEFSAHPPSSDFSVQNNLQALQKYHHKSQKSCKLEGRKGGGGSVFYRAETAMVALKPNRIGSQHYCKSSVSLWKFDFHSQQKFCFISAFIELKGPPLALQDP